ncbi:serpentine type 7TM GPCR chemoreceptor srbc domain-containing protein [Ditylenchus destructor]|nr:serpentine type 7TM GPCR chemoreceptor srbc domain-containing protein [Ditylenchus destructor]
MYSCTPIVPLFLSIERITVISYPLAGKGYKRILTTVTVVLIAICFGCNLVAIFQEFPLPPHIEGCLVAACLLSSRVAGLTYTYTKIMCGFLNLFAGTIFLIKLKYYTEGVVKSLQSPQSVSGRTNRMAVLVICLELCFNFIPQMTAIVLNKTMGISLVQYIGSYNFMGRTRRK